MMPPLWDGVKLSCAIRLMLKTRAREGSFPEKHRPLIFVGHGTLHPMAFVARIFRLVVASKQS